MCGAVEYTLRPAGPLCEISWDTNEASVIVRGKQTHLLSERDWKPFLPIGWTQEDFIRVATFWNEGYDLGFTRAFYNATH